MLILKEKNHINISIDAEKPFEELQYSLLFYKKTKHKRMRNAAFTQHNPVELEVFSVML